jgi:hypothetical protein
MTGGSTAVTALSLIIFNPRYFAGDRLRLRCGSLDIAVVIARQIRVYGRPSQRAASHLTPAVDPRQPCIHPQSELEDQLCVPLMTLKGASYRLRNRGIDTLPSIRTGAGEPDA